MANFNTTPTPESAPTLYAKALNIYRGDTFVKTFTMLRASDNTPIDLTVYGELWSAQLRGREDNVDDIPFTLDLTNLSTGKITLRLDSAATAQLPSKGVWDLQVVDATQSPAYVRTLIRGSFTRIKDVTRP